MIAATEVAPAVGKVVACFALGVSRAAYYRRQQPPRPPVEKKPKKPSPRALSESERTAVLTVLNSPRFVDQAPAQVQATLLDEGVYHCSTRTMYRLLDGADEVRERRNQLQHPTYSKPELVATTPHHSGIGLLTPASVHHGQAPDILAKRQETLTVLTINTRATSINSILFMGSQGQGTNYLPLGSVADQSQALPISSQFHNSQNPCDVNSDGSVTPLDALVIINQLKSTGPIQLSNNSPASLQAGDFLFDVNDDDWLSPLDVLQVINSLNSTGHSSIAGVNELGDVANRPSARPASTPNLASPAVAPLVSNATLGTVASVASQNSGAANSGPSSNASPKSTPHDAPF